MSLQHNSEIAKEAFDLLHGKCPKGCDGELLVIISDKKINYDKSDHEIVNTTLIYNFCKRCGYTGEI